MDGVRKNKAHFTQSQQQLALALLPLLGAVLPSVSASAQVIAADDAIGTTTDVVGDRIDIAGGQLSSDNANLFHSFENFNVTAEQTANFVAPNANIQNIVGRVNGGQGSVIDGTLQVSGSEANLYLMNPAGILTGPNAQLNLPGSFTATSSTAIGFEHGEFAADGNLATHHLNGTPETFHFASEQPGAVVNLGELSVAAGESITLVGGTVVNTGELSAPEGSLTLAAVEGESLVRISQGEQLLSLEVEAPESYSSIVNDLSSGNIGALLTGPEMAPVTALVTNADGSVSLRGTAPGREQAIGEQAIREQAIAQTGGHVVTTGTLSTQGNIGGDINILGRHIALTDATLNASGTYGGGSIRVGGDYQGQGPIETASTTIIDSLSSLSADAVQAGDGGSVIAWADSYTQFEGDISATGGTLSGDGGFVEVSGKIDLALSGKIDVSAPAGELGDILIDPFNLVITDGAPPPNTVNTSYQSSTTTEGLTGNVTIAADNNITIEDLADNELLFAVGTNVSFIADADNDGNGNFSMNLGDRIRSEQGDIAIAGANITAGTLDTSTPAQDPGGNGNITGGDVVISATENIVAESILTLGRRNAGPQHSANGGQVTLTTSGGSVTINEKIDTSSFINGRRAGDGGNITIEARDNIQLRAMPLPGAGFPASTVLNSASTATDRRSGRGGDISLLTTNGNIAAYGVVSTQSQANDSNSGNGGEITLTASNGNISTGSLYTMATAGAGLAGNSGSVSITGQDVLINEIFTFSNANGNNAGNGGNVDIFASSVEVLSHINTVSQAQRETQNAGNINITAPDSIEIGGQLTAYSFAMSGANAGNGGAVDLISNNIAVNDIDTLTRADDWTPAYSGLGRPGNITLAEFSDIPGSSISAGNINSSSFSDNSDSRNGGNVAMTADTISLSAINTSSRADDDDNAGNGGNISIQGGQSVFATGNLRTNSFADEDNAGNGGTIDITGDTVELLGNINTSSVDDDGQTGNAGSITVTTGTSNIIRGSISALSSGNGQDAAVSLIGDEIALLGGNNSIEVGSIAFDTATNGRRIRLGDEINTIGLGLSNQDLAAVGRADQMLIGNANSTSNIRVLEAAIASTIPIHIQGGDRVNSRITTGTTFHRTDNTSGYIAGSQVTFTNIEELRAAGNPTNNVVTYENFVGPQATLDLSTLSNIGNVIGANGTPSTLQAEDTNNMWTVTGLNSGTVSGITFSDFDTIETASNANTVQQFLYTNPTSLISGSISVGDSDLELIGDEITIGTNNGVTGNGNLFIRPANNQVDIQIGGIDTGAVQTLTLTDNEIAAIQPGFTSIEIGGENQIGGIRLADTVTFADTVMLQTQGSVEGDAAGGSRAGVASIGDVVIESTDGDIAVGAIATIDGNVTLLSGGSIEVEFIDTQGPNNNTTDAKIVVDAQTDFVATGTAATGSSIVTRRAGADAVSLRYGNANRDAVNFTVGTGTQNGIISKIETGANSITTGLFPGNHVSGNIELVNRGRGIVSSPPTPDLPNDLPESPNPSLISATLENSVAAASTTAEQPAVVYTGASSNEVGSIVDVFTQIEIGVSSNFSQHLGLDQEQRKPTTLYGMQSTLAEVHRETGVTPALIYVYFVPDAADPNAVVTGSERPPMANDQLEVMLITQDSDPIRRRQWGVTRAQVNEASQNLRRYTTSEFSAPRQYLEPGQQLYDWIMQSLESELHQRNVQSIGFVMDTGLRTIPIATLHDGEQFLVENYSLGLLPTFSLTDFESIAIGSAAQDRLRDRTNFSDTQVLAMGASEFDDQPDLPAVSAEINLITKKLWEGDAFLNEDFNLENLRSQLQDEDYGIIHLATHAAFESGDLENSFIQLWDDRLSLTDMAALNLSEADIRMIILSACSTALGDEDSEYGFAGFAVNAGSQSAMASLWPVNDEGTLGFMAQFYRHLDQAPVRADALRQAQMSLIRGEVGINDGEVYGPEGELLAELPSLANSGRWDFSHPFYWSAFTMIGNPW